MFVAVLMVTAVLMWGAVQYFQPRVGSGNFLPEFSSLRHDPLGTSILFESLERVLPAVDRNFLPVQQLQSPPAALLILNVQPSELAPGAGLDYKAAEQLANEGHRVVIALDSRGIIGAPMNLLIKESWGITFISATADKPLAIFARDKNWTSLDSGLFERKAGKGSIVLHSHSGDYLNASLVGGEEFELLVQVLGGYDRVLFDEAHLGVGDAGSIMGLISVYRLQGMLAGIALCALLFIWKNAVSFPPVGRDSESLTDAIAGRTSRSGLIALLSRNLNQKDLAGTCWREWLKGNASRVSQTRRSAAEAAIHEFAADPVEALGRAHRIIQSKGDN